MDITNLYITTQKIFEDLDNIYDKFDPYDTINVILYNPDFDIKNEIFDIYLIRFIFIIILFQLSERKKIF